MNWISLDIAGQTRDAVFAEVSHRLDEVPTCRVRYAVSANDTTRPLGQGAKVTLKDASGRELTFSGEVIEWTWLDEFTDKGNQAIVEAMIAPRLNRLSLGSDARVFQGLSAIELASGLLKEAGITSDATELSLTRTYAPLPYKVQWRESSLVFFKRNLAKEGVGFYVAMEQKKEDGSIEPAQTVTLFDHVSHLPYSPHGVLPLIAPSGTVQSNLASNITGAVKTALTDNITNQLSQNPLGKTLAESGLTQKLGLDKLAANATHTEPCFDYLESTVSLASPVAVHDYNENSPEAVVLSGTSRTGDLSHYGPGVAHLEEAERLAKDLSESERLHHRNLKLQGNVGLWAGEVFSLSAEKESGDFYVTAATLTATQPSSDGMGDTKQGGLRARYEVAPRDLPYRPKTFENPVLPLAFTARIETEGPYALLDEQGRQVLRSIFDVGSTPNTQASPFFRKSQPFGGPTTEGLATGLHLPLRHDTEVIWGCIHGDPDRPIILGTLPNPNTPSPVTANNNYDNRLRTAGNNELLMRDLKGEETIQLKQGDVDSPTNLFELSATAGEEAIRLSTAQGAASLYAKQTFRVKAGDSVLHKHGNHRTETIENKSSLTTKNQQIHTQAANDHTETARQNIKLEAGANIELKAGKDYLVRAEQNLTVRTRQGNIIHVAQGNYRLQSQNGILIESLDGGTIKIGSNGGFIVVEPNHIRITGNTVSLNGPTKMKGKVNYMMGAGSLASATALEPLSVSDIPKLNPQGAPAIVNLAFEPEIVPVGSETKLLFTAKNFKGGESTSVTIYKYPDGDETRKTVVDSLSTTLEDGTGQITLPWTPPADTVESNTSTADSELTVKGPDEYRFEVKINGTQSEEPSAPLWLARDVIIETANENGETLPEGTEIKLTPAIGEARFALVENGQARFAQIVVGRFETEVTNTTHTKNT